MPAQEIIAWSLASLLTLLVILSGAMKLAGAPNILATLTKVNVVRYKNFLGIAEIAFALLFIYPPTSHIGFLLLICYFSGAVATDLSHQNLFMPALVILVLIFVTGFLRSPSLFFIN